MSKVRWVLLYGFVANFIRFPTVKNFENRLRFDKVTESLKVGTFLRHSVDIASAVNKDAVRVGRGGSRNLVLGSTW